MKRYLVAAAVLLSLIFLSMQNVAAQSRFGVIGGFTFSNSDVKNINRSTMTQYHAGITYQLKLPFGFSLQPSLVYQVKGSKLKGVSGGQNTFDLSIGYLELPVSFQWGPDLLLFRPFLDVTPFIGYGLNNRMDLSSSLAEVKPLRNEWSSVGLQRFEYGLGLGIGLELWKFQVIGRYNWNFGSLYDLKADIQDDVSFGQMMKGAFDGHNFRGFTLSVSFLF